MAIKPILFNTEMVRAILDGRKSCTRRVVKPQPTARYGVQCIKPPYQPGDILYVRETVWQKIGHCLDMDGETKPSWYNEFRYATSDEKPEVGWNYSWVKRSSIHMPKEAARIWLKVTNVRVERLQKITEDGCIAEGVYPSNCRGCNATFGCDNCPDEGYNEIDEFSEIWDSTIKKSDLDRYGWDANPYVWVIEFERCEKPGGV